MASIHFSIFDFFKKSITPQNTFRTLSIVFHFSTFSFGFFLILTKVNQEYRKASNDMIENCRVECHEICFWEK